MPPAAGSIAGDRMTRAHGSRLLVSGHCDAETKVICLLDLSKWRASITSSPDRPMRRQQSRARR